MYTHFQNSKIFYTHEGAGETLVLLHGFLESSNIWREWSSEFSKHREIICIDLPGHGRSGSVGNLHSMGLMADAVLTVLEELKIIKATFVGHSMGGYVILSFLDKHPEYVKKIVLLNSTPAPDTPEKKKNRERSISLVQKSKSTFISMAINNLMPPDDHQKFKKELDILEKDALGFPAAGITALLKGMKIRTDKQAVLRSFNGEKYLIAGKKDPILDFKEVRSLAKATGCRFIPMPGGHMSLIDSKEELKNLCISSNN